VAEMTFSVSQRMWACDTCQEGACGYRYPWQSMHSHLQWTTRITRATAAVTIIST